jgi:hypothetical protein
MNISQVMAIINKTDFFKQIEDIINYLILEN